MAPPAKLAQCERCETSVFLVGDQLPEDWIRVNHPARGSTAYCPDCQHAAPKARTSGARAIATQPAGPAPSRHRGCRIGHEVALGIAAIQIRAGANPPPGRDEVVQFLLDPAALHELIVELGAIRAALVGQPS
ncbi:hypothetical protein HMF7854_04335 [Sphingomonas ginkgonis]|uniref:Uncharacterized protein n=1 Tax=Sphingomonas ginkgonis TaxID=2315330 RepID=A0A429V876_9SPHN|nr:hypothetical protein [Sphingomonas ginkgonis]RST30138.1 hypothetical protein HMF7854_04335 [Sphingomonas ginkgonis]